MTNQIGLNVTLTLTPVGASLPIANWASGILALTQVGNRFTQYIANVSTMGAFNPGTSIVGTVGYVMIKNLDTSTNQYVAIGSSSLLTNLIQLSAGQVAVFPAGPGLSPLYMLAQSTACQVEVLVLEL